MAETGENGIGKMMSMARPHHRVQQVKSLVDFQAVQQDVLRRSGLQATEDSVGISSLIGYRFENFVSSNRQAPFYALGVVILLVTVIFGRIWQDVADEEELTFWQGCWVAFQIIVASGTDSSVNNTGKVMVALCLLLCGMIIFAVLIGMITESFQASIGKITEGKTAVAASGHTLLLGWNETTMRTVCQIAFLRRQWRILNSTFLRRFLFIGRIKASSPVAVQPIVIMCNTKTKSDMEDEIRAAFADRGISPKRTRLGWDVICRVGDPSDIQDLVRVGAARATSIMVQMTDEDDREEVAHAGHVQNGMTLRTLLALRFVLFSAKKKPDWDNLRIVVQLDRPCRVMEAATFTAPCGRKVVFLQDLSMFLNNLMFTCALQPGLSDVLVSALSFEGAAIRARRADTFPDKGASIIGKTVREAAFVWEDCIMLGVIGEDGAAIQQDVIQPEEGIAPSADRVVKADDRVIFFGPTSVPKLLKAPPNELIRDPSIVHATEEATKLNILVLGWRKEWDEPARFRFRLTESLTRIEKGSHVTFMTHHDAEDFASHIKSTGVPGLVRDGDSWRMNDWATVSQVTGEPSFIEDLEPVLSERTYNRAVVLSDKSLNAYSRDTRILSVMCLLRYLQERLEQPAMSVVAENALNQSASLAIAPADKTSKSDPDFVNMQAIQARVLTASLAYPKIEPAVRELFMCHAGAPEISMQPMTDYAAPGTKITFYGLQQAVKEVHSSDICIGWRSPAGKLSICPKQGDIMKAEFDGAVVVISRCFRDKQGVRASGDGPALHLHGDAPVVIV